jgi:hypothetical protein
MPKIPRDISGRELAKLLNVYKYETHMTVSVTKGDEK